MRPTCMPPHVIARDDLAVGAVSSGCQALRDGAAHVAEAPLGSHAHDFAIIGARLGASGAATGAGAA